MENWKFRRPRRGIAAAVAGKLLRRQRRIGTDRNHKHDVEVDRTTDETVARRSSRLDYIYPILNSAKTNATVCIAVGPA